MASGTRARCRRAAGALLACLSIVLGVAPGAIAVPSRLSGPAPPVRLLHQTPVIRRSGQLLDLSLTDTGPAAQPGATVALTLYARLTTRSDLLAAIGAPGPTAGVSATPAVPASCLSKGGQLHISVAVAPLGASVAPRRRCGEEAPVLRLGCASLCDGVYPLRIVVIGGGAATALVTLVTYAKRSPSPLRVAWVVRVAGAASDLRQANPALTGLAAHATVPATLDVQGSAVAKAGTGGTAALLRAATAPRAHELLAEPYVAADLGALRASLLTTEVLRQYALSAVSLATIGVRGPPTRSVSYATGPPTPTMADAAGSVGVHRLLIDGTALSVDPASTLSWGDSFTITGASGGVRALATDTELDALSSQTAADPGLAAAQFLGELAFLHFEQPNLPEPRAVVVVTTATAQVTTAFVDSVLAGLADNPVLRPVTASGAFAAVPVGANGFPPTRALVLGPSSPFPSDSVTQIRFLRNRTDALSSAVPPGQSQTPIPSIEGELLSAEQVMPDAERTTILNGVHYSLEQELGNFHIDDGTITLTESGASLPVTVLSSAPYTVMGTIRLSSRQITFPNGASEHIKVDASVRSVRIAARALTNGDLLLYATFVSPDGRLVMARAKIIVRATPTSIVGFALTGGAILVLALWWIRTSMRRRAAR